MLIYESKWVEYFTKSLNKEGTTDVWNQILNGIVMKSCAIGSVIDKH